MTLGFNLPKQTSGLVPDPKIQCAVPWGSILGPLFLNMLTADIFYQCDDWHYADDYVDKTKPCTLKTFTKFIVCDTSSTFSTK